MEVEDWELCVHTSNTATSIPERELYQNGEEPSMLFALNRETAKKMRIVKS